MYVYDASLCPASWSTIINHQAHIMYIIIKIYTLYTYTHYIMISKYYTEKIRWEIDILLLILCLEHDFIVSFSKSNINYTP
jgi:hypothetical protein